MKVNTDLRHQKWKKPGSSKTQVKVLPLLKLKKGRPLMMLKKSHLRKPRKENKIWFRRLWILCETPGPVGKRIAKADAERDLF